VFNLIFQGSTPLKPGDTFALSIDGDEPARVKIKCFVQYPPPPKYKECPECGEFTLSVNLPMAVTVSDLFWNNSGKLEFKATGLSSHAVQELSVEVRGS
jgi:hypothetical protein